MVDIYHLPAQVYPIPVTAPKLNIIYPRVFIQNLQAQQMINQGIVNKVESMFQEQHYIQGQTEMTGSFEIKTNERAILSLILSNYAFTYPAAHGLTIIKSISANIETGQIYQLKDLFKPDSNYVQRLSNIIKKQIKQRELSESSQFETIEPNQDFYIADKTLVIYFQLYEILPYSAGFPMFPIPVYEIRDIIREDGPLGRMIPY